MVRSAGSRAIKFMERDNYFVAVDLANQKFAHGCADDEMALARLRGRTNLVVIENLTSEQASSLTGRFISMRGLDGDKVAYSREKFPRTLAQLRAILATVP